MPRFAASGDGRNMKKILISAALLASTTLAHAGSGEALHRIIKCAGDAPVVVPAPSPPPDLYRPRPIPNVLVPRKRSEDEEEAHPPYTPPPPLPPPPAPK